MADALLCLVRPLLSGVVKLISGATCNKVVAVVVPRYCGKSHFVNSISADSTLLLDLEENITLQLSADEKEKLQSLVGNSSYNLHYFPICKKYLEETKKNHKFKRIVIFVSDLSLVKYLGIKEVHTFIPSNTLTRTLGDTLTEDKKSKLEESRLALLLATKKINTFSDFGELSKALIDKFKLQQKL